MIRHTLTVENRTFALRDDAHAQQIREAVTEAVRQGGGVVDITVDEHSSASALVSPGVPVFFFTHLVDDDSEDSDAWNGFVMDPADYEL